MRSRASHAAGSDGRLAPKKGIGSPFLGQGCVDTICTDVCSIPTSCRMCLFGTNYCNSILYRIVGNQLLRIQRIQNTAARLILQLNRWSRTTTMLNESHWLPINKRISFKALLMLYKAIHDLARDYIRVLATPYVPQQTTISSLFRKHISIMVI